MNTLDWNEFWHKTPVIHVRTYVQLMVETRAATVCLSSSKKSLRCFAATRKTRSLQLFSDSRDDSVNFISTSYGFSSLTLEAFWFRALRVHATARWNRSTGASSRSIQMRFKRDQAGVNLAACTRRRFAIRKSRQQMKSLSIIAPINISMTSRCNLKQL